jgi:hypothetical protein
MIAGHDDFEVLCALAATGDLTKAEHAVLREHVKNCVACQSRLVEVRRLAIPLLLAQQLKTPGKQSRNGLQERFAERAIREGIPLRPRPQGVGFSALGIVTVVLVVLLLVTATLQHSPARRSVVDTGTAESARASAPLQNANSTPRFPVPAGVRRIRRDRRSSTTVPPVAKPEPPAIELAALSGHQFTFTLTSRNLGMRVCPSSTTIRLPEVVSSLTFAHRAPGLPLDTTSEVFRHNAPHLLAESEYGASSPIHFRSNLASQSLDLDTYRNTLKANFKTGGFELIHDVVPGTTSQERSQ